MNIEHEFIEVLLQHKQIIYKVCFMFSKEKEDIEDLYQEVVFNLWKAYDSFEERSKISTWIYRVALNTCITDVRKKKRQQIVSLEHIKEIAEECERDEMLHDMYSLIKRLNALERMYILLWLDEKTYEDIAEIIGTTRSNVAIRLHRIKEKLKQMSID